MPDTIPMSPPRDLKGLHKSSSKGSSQESLIIEARDGKRHELTSSKLDHWFASLEKKNPAAPKQGEPNNERLLGQFGLQTSQDVIRFLKSESGKAVLAAIKEELAEIASLRNQQFIDDRDKKTHHYRMLGWLFLGLIYKRKAHARHLNEAIQKQIDEKLHKKKPDSDTKLSESTHQALTAELDHYSKSISALESTLDYRQQEKIQVDNELLLLQQQWLAIQERHAVFDARLDELVLLSKGLEDDSITPDARELTINEKLEEAYAHLSNLDTEISTHINNNQNDVAAHLMHRHSAHILHAEGIQDMLAVARGEKKLFTLDGAETRSLQDAHFILSRNQKIVKDGAGQHYLIGINDDLNMMDEAKKEKAMRKFDEKQTEILTVPKLVHHHCNLEKKLHNQRQQHAQLRSDGLNGSITLLRNQLLLVQAAKASVTAELEKPTPDLNRAAGHRNTVPKIANNGHAFPYAGFSPDVTLQGLRTTLSGMQRKPLTLDELDAFKGNMAALYGKTGLAIPEIMRKNLNRIMPGQPVPPRTLMNLNAQLHKLELAAIRSMEPQPEPAPETPASTAPTPFGTWPPKPAPR